jgi:hypothetical protein
MGYKIVYPFFTVEWSSTEFKISLTNRNKPMAKLENPWEPTSVRNMDVVGMVERIDRFAYDIMHFESAQLNEITSFDLERIAAYNEALRNYASTINSAESMDLPHSYPHMYEIHYATSEMELDTMKNKALRDIIRLYINAWVQWSRSESADKSNSFHPADYNRFILIMNRLDQYIASYVQATLPLDMPESSNYEDDATKR